MNNYELVFIVRPDVATDQVAKVSDRIKELVNGQSGKTVKSEDWGLKTLAYRIRKYAKGYYQMLVIEMPGAGVAEIERNLNLMEDVIRFILVKVDEIEEGPSVMLKRREESSSEEAQL